MPAALLRWWSAWCAVVASVLAVAQAPGLVPLPVPGIADATVTCFAQDAAGALWMGTDRGLVRFDGAATERYVSEPSDADALPHDMVFELLVDGDELWVATAGGAWRLNTRTGARKAVRYAQPNAPAKQQEALAFASSRTGHWAFALSLGAYHFTTGDSLHRAVEEDAPAPQRASGGWEAPDGSLWYCDRMALRHFTPATHHVDIFPLQPFGGEAPPKTLLLDVIPDRYNAHILWCRSWGLGLVRFDMRTGEFMPFVASRPLSDLSNIVHAAVQTGPDSWLLNLDERLAVLEGSSLHTASMVLGKGGLYRTTDGDLLIGSHGSVHLARHRPDRMQELGGGPSLLNSYTVTTLANDGYWVTHFYGDRKLIRCDRDGRELRVLPFPIESPPAEPFLLLMARGNASRGTLWMGSSHGLWSVANDAADLRKVDLVMLGLSTTQPGITAMAEDDDGTLWLCLGNDGLAHYDPRSGAARWVARNEQGGDRFMSVARLDKDHLFAVRRNSAPLLMRMDGTQALEMRVPIELQRLYSKLEGGLATAEGDALFYTVGLGLVRLKRGAQPEELVFDRTWYLPDRPVFSHAERDARGRIWLTSDRGAYLLDPVTDALHPLDPLHGVPHANISNVSASQEGEVLLLGEGALRFTPSFEPVRDTMALAFRSVRISTIDRTGEALTGTVRTTASANNLTVTFSSVALFAGDVFTYAYQLTHDDEVGAVVELGRQRTLNLLGLAPGIYTLEVKATGTASPPATAAFTFVVEPAWWQTWWARLLFTVLGVALVVLVTRAVLAARYRRRLRELEREREVERVRMRIARDIHDGIGSGLTKITMMTRQLHGDSAQAKRIAQASTELVNELGEIVWTVDPRNDSYGSFLAYVRNTLGKQFEHLQVELRTELHCEAHDRDRTIGPELKRNVLLVIKEAVNNALKHSGATRIEVHLSLTHDHLDLRVSDNGHGFDPANIREGANGLINFRKRAEAMHGQLDIRTSAEGTAITLRAPNPSTNM